MSRTGEEFEGFSLKNTAAESCALVLLVDWELGWKERMSEKLRVWYVKEMIQGCGCILERSEWSGLKGSVNGSLT